MGLLLISFFLLYANFSYSKKNICFLGLICSIFFLRESISFACCLAPPGAIKNPCEPIQKAATLLGGNDHEQTISSTDHSHSDSSGSSTLQHW